MAAGTWEIQISRVLVKFGVIKKPLQENAAEELESALQDYHDLAQQHSEMLKKFCYDAKPIRKNGVWVCPDCNRRIQYNHSHCHYCGRKVGWDRWEGQNGKGRY